MYDPFYHLWLYMCLLPIPSKVVDKLILSTKIGLVYNCRPPVKNDLDLKLSSMLMIILGIKATNRYVYLI